MATAAVAAGNGETARVAAEILRMGGNAFDAAIAGMTAACVSEPILCSFGGGGFLLAQPADGPAHIVDFFTQTPGRASAENLDFREISADFGTTTQNFHIGRAAAAVPGMVAGLFHIHKTLGRLPLGETLAPAIELATKGAPLDPLQAVVLRVVEPIATSTEGARALYCDEKGEIIRAHEPFRPEGFAEFLRMLVEEGPDLFYKGPIAELICRDSAEGGLLNAADLAGYKVVTRAPRLIDYCGARIALNDLPSSGGPLIAYSLKLLETAGGVCGNDSPQRAAILADVMARTGDARRRSGFAHDPCPDTLFRLFAECPDLKSRALKTGGTTHLSIVDRDGALAALSLSNGEGNGHIIPGTGIAMNNMLGEEDLNPSGFFKWKPDTRVSSMMTPCVANLPDGRHVALGSGGSNRIRSAILQVLVNLVDGGAAPDAAIAAPRLHVENGHLSIEGGHTAAIVEHLTASFPTSQTWDTMSFYFGGVHVAGIGPDGVFAAGDPRRGGAAILIP